jgi:hypothetical protein
MFDPDRDFEAKRVRDLLAQAPGLSLKAEMDVNSFQNVLDRLVS